MYENAAEGYSYDEPLTGGSEDESDSEANLNRILELKKQGFEGRVIMLMRVKLKCRHVVK